MISTIELLIDEVHVSAYSIPTDAPESDGTLEWNHTTIVVVELTSADIRALGYTYADRAAAVLIQSLLADKLLGADASAIRARFVDMSRAVRNLGRPGISSMAISAVDVALWDLKAKSLNLPLAALLGQVRDCVELYGSGGFTSYDEGRLCKQLGEWAATGMRHVKMKVGRDPEADPKRVAAARRTIGPDCEMFVDANGAYSRKQALALAEQFVAQGVKWFEEPVSSDDLEGLHLLRDRAPRECRSPPANMATMPGTSSECSRHRPSTCCRPTPRAAAE